MVTRSATCASGPGDAANRTCPGAPRGRHPRWSPRSSSKSLVATHLHPTTPNPICLPYHTKSVCVPWFAYGSGTRTPRALRSRQPHCQRRHGPALNNTAHPATPPRAAHAVGSGVRTLIPRTGNGVRPANGEYAAGKATNGAGGMPLTQSAKPHGLPPHNTEVRALQKLLRGINLFWLEAVLEAFHLHRVFLLSSHTRWSSCTNAFQSSYKAVTGCKSGFGGAVSGGWKSWAGVVCALSPACLPGTLWPFPPPAPPAPGLQEETIPTETVMWILPFRRPALLGAERMAPAALSPTTPSVSHTHKMRLRRSTVMHLESRSAHRCPTGEGVGVPARRKGRCEAQRGRLGQRTSPHLRHTYLLRAPSISEVLRDGSSGLDTVPDGQGFRTEHASGGGSGWGSSSQGSSVREELRRADDDWPDASGECGGGIESRKQEGRRQMHASPGNWGVLMLPALGTRAMGRDVVEEGRHLPFQVLDASAIEGIRGLVGESSSIYSCIQIYKALTPPCPPQRIAAQRK